MLIWVLQRKVIQRILRSMPLQNKKREILYLLCKEGKMLNRSKKKTQSGNLTKLTKLTKLKNLNNKKLKSIETLTSLKNKNIEKYNSP